MVTFVESIKHIGGLLRLSIIAACSLTVLWQAEPANAVTVAPFNKAQFVDSPSEFTAILEQTDGINGGSDVRSFNDTIWDPTRSGTGNPKRAWGLIVPVTEFDGKGLQSDALKFDTLSAWHIIPPGGLLHKNDVSPNKHSWSLDATVGGTGLLKLKPGENKFAFGAFKKHPESHLDEFRLDLTVFVAPDGLNISGYKMKIKGEHLGTVPLPASTWLVIAGLLPFVALRRVRVRTH